MQLEIVYSYEMIQAYAITILRFKGLHVINMKNPDDIKFIERICDELYCTKDVVLGVNRDEIFYFDPSVGEVIAISA